MLILYLILFSVPTYDYSNLVRGTTGFGITVFEGNKPDTFGVEIIGIRRGVAAGQDIILARLTGERIKETGVISGMSGSPVYIDGKLLGAIAYNMGGAFSKEPICGITPIGSMLNPPGIGFHKTDIDARIPIPVSFSNISNSALSLFQEEIEGLGLQSVLGASIDSIINTENRQKLFPGSPIGILLVSGDARIGGTGTVTHIDENRVYALGHRFMGLGTVQLPLTTAYIHTVASSHRASFKIAEIGNTIGYMEMDAFTGISGQIGRLPSMLNMRVQYGEIDYQYKLAKAEGLVPFLINLMLANSIFTNYSTGNVTYLTDFNLKMKEKEVNFSDIYSGNVLDAVIAMMEDIGSVIQNPYTKLDIDSIRIDLTPYYEIRVAELNEIQGEIRDDTLFIIYTLTPYRKRPLRVVEKIPIRDSDKEKSLSVTASGANSLRMRMRNEVRDIDGFIRYMEDRPKRSSIIIQVWGQNDNLLPLSYTRLARERNRPLYEKIIETEWLIIGEAISEIDN
ncbi:hypothetical protein LR066_02195 [candidate division WOR-3 bacterium]|nr:hypothetical protein [candidate division WOR-3 bacterium]